MKKIKNLLLSLSIIGITILSSHFNVEAKDIKIQRFQGANRYETCANISEAGWEKSGYAMIVSGENYPDSIVSSPLAYKFEAPILLVQKNNIPTCIKNELKRLKAKKVFIVGGNASVSKNVENQLKAMGIQVYIRIAGKDRYETSAKMEHYLASDEDHEYFVADGDEWQDVLLLSLVANQKQSPVFLTRNPMYPTPECIRRKNLKRSYAKATALVYASSRIFMKGALNQEIDIHPYEVIKGSMPIDKNLAIREKYKGGYMRMNNIYLASSKGFADSLSISIIVSANNGSLFFVDEKNKDRIKDYIITHHGGDVNTITVIGGEKLIPDSYVNEIVNGINSVDASNTIKDEIKLINFPVPVDKNRPRPSDDISDYLNNHYSNNRDIQRAYEFQRNGIKTTNGDNIDNHDLVLYCSYSEKTEFLLDLNTNKIYQRVGTDSRGIGVYSPIIII